MKHSAFYWQPQKDYLRLITSSKPGKVILVILNYLIWLFLFYVSFLLIRFNINFFWQILFATITSEAVERYLKSKVYWVRPMFLRHDSTPPGLVDKWYKTGSFPSGHTIKATFFLLFLLSTNVFPIPVYLAIVSPLIFFRVLVGFHYPMDIVGGTIVGFLVYWLNCWYLFPPVLNKLVKLIFDTIFFIK